MTDRAELTNEDLAEHVSKIYDMMMEQNEVLKTILDYLANANYRKEDNG
jgi:hypothetical protein